MHDGSKIVLQKLDRDYDPYDRINAIKTVQEANQNDILLTGLIFVDTSSKSLIDLYELPKERATQPHRAGVKFALRRRFSTVSTSSFSKLIASMTETPPDRAAFSLS